MANSIAVTKRTGKDPWIKEKGLLYGRDLRQRRAARVEYESGPLFIPFDL